MNQETGKKISQKEQVAEKLAELKPNITASDRKAAMSLLGVPASLISNYINGDVRDIEIGLALALFFKSRIDERASQLATI